jgi:DNA polymerase-3 subunit alpha
MTNFINLHTNTEYSLLESSIKIDKLIEFAKKNKLTTLAITDHNNMFGVAEFVEKTRKNNIRPIIGLDLDVEDYRLILVAQNYDGYLHLLELSSKKMSDGEVNLSDIHSANLYVIDHPRLGCYQIHKRQPKIQNYYCGLDKGSDPNGVAIFETRTLFKEESNILPILENIKSAKKIMDIPVKDYSFKLEANMEFAMVKQAEKIASKCNVVFPKYINQIPKFDQEKISSNYLRQLLLKSLNTLFKTFPKLDKEVYTKRYKHEFNVITSMGYEDYFLIIADMTQ